MVKVAEAVELTGVPVISPELVLKFKPLGSAGVIDQEEAEPPALVGLTVVATLVATKVNAEAAYEIFGASSKTAISIVRVSVPPSAFSAVIVKFAALCVADGVPEITPVVLFRLRPDTRVGVTDQEDAAPPEFTGVIADMATPTVNE